MTSARPVAQATGTTCCPGCGLVAPDTGGQPPIEHTVSAACFDRYGQLLARSYGDSAYRPVHQLIVDAYAAQHAGGTSRREVQAVALCLMTLCLFVEDGVDPQQGPRLHQQMVLHRPTFTWLQPPSHEGMLTVADVLTAPDAVEHQRLVREWARQVWQSWAAHHATVRTWNRHALT